MGRNIRDFVLEGIRDFSTPERPIYLVGGAVRDLLLNQQSHDLDFVITGETIELARLVAGRLGGSLYVMDEGRKTTRIVLDQETLGGTPQSHLFLDFSVLRGRNIHDDLYARDLTINAMAINVNQADRLIDPTSGLADLREGRIRACSPDSLSSDPVRVLRAVRLGVALGFRIEPDTFRLIQASVSHLPSVSAERVRDELFRILDSSRVSLALSILDRAGALSYVLPELVRLKGIGQSQPHVNDVWEHTLGVIQHLEKLLDPLVGFYQEDSVSDLTIGSAVLWLGRYREKFEQHFSKRLVPDRSIKSLLFLAALYHDISKPQTRELIEGGKVRFIGHQEKGAIEVIQRARKLALSTNEIDRLDKIVRHHMRVHFMTNSLLSPNGSSPSRRTIYRFFRDTRTAGIDICLLSLADVRGTYETTLPQDVWEAELSICRSLLEACWEHNHEVVSPPRLVSGHELMEEFKLQPGKLIGQLLDAIREAQAAGEIHNHHEALEFVNKQLVKATDNMQSDTMVGVQDEEGED